MNQLSISEQQRLERLYRKNPALRQAASLPIEVQKEYNLESKHQDKITFIIPFRGQDRLTHLTKCCINLERRYPNSEIIIVEEDITPNIKGRIGNARYVFSYSKRLFNKSKCFNLGFMVANNSIICGVDCDMLVPSTILDLNLQYIKEDKVVFPGKDIYYVISEATPDNLNTPIWWHKTWNKDKADWQFHGGLWIATKKAFASVGGFDHRFEGYGSEDTNFYMRAMSTHQGVSVRNTTLIHIEHGYSSLEHEAMETNKRLLIIYSRINPPDRVAECKLNNIFATK